MQNVKLATVRHPQRPFEGYPRVVLGAIGSFLGPFCGFWSPKVDNLDFGLMFEGRWVVQGLFVAHRFYVVYRRLLGPVDPLVRAIYERLKFTV